MTSERFSPSVSWFSYPENGSRDELSPAECPKGEGGHSLSAEGFAEGPKSGTVLETWHIVGASQMDTLTLSWVYCLPVCDFGQVASRL